MRVASRPSLPAGEKTHFRRRRCAERCFGTADACVVQAHFTIACGIPPSRISLGFILGKLLVSMVVHRAQIVYNAFNQPSPRRGQSAQQDQDDAITSQKHLADESVLVDTL